MKGHQITTTWAFATAAAAAQAVARAMPRLGSLRALPLCAHDAGRARALRRRGRGFVRCGGARGGGGAEARAPAGASSPSCFPSSTREAEFAWAASFGESATGLPTIGEIPAPQELLGRARLRRQRHHLQPDRRRDHPLGADRRAGCGRRSLRVQALKQRVRALSAEPRPALPFESHKQFHTAGGSAADGLLLPKTSRP